MTVRDDIRQALYDAIGWQQGLVHAWPAGSPERQEAIDQIKAYRRILKRRYSETRHPSEAAFDGAKPVSIFDLKSS